MHRYKVKIKDSRIDHGESSLSFDDWNSMVFFLRKEVVRLNDRNIGLDFDLIMEHGIIKVLSYSYMIFGFTRIEINEETSP